MALPSGYDDQVFGDDFTVASDTSLASHTPDVGSGYTISSGTMIARATDDLAVGTTQTTENAASLDGVSLTGDFLCVMDAKIASGGTFGSSNARGGFDFSVSGGYFGLDYRYHSQVVQIWRYSGADGYAEANYTIPNDTWTQSLKEIAFERVGDTFKLWVEGSVEGTLDVSGTSVFSSSPTATAVIRSTYLAGDGARIEMDNVAVYEPGTDVAVSAASVQITTYAATITGTAFSNDIAVGSASVQLTTYAATITGTAFSNDVSVGVASVQLTTYAATITGTAFSNDVAVGVASVQITTYAATITGTAPGTDVAVGLAQVQITTYAATITGTSPATNVAVGVAAVQITTYGATITGTQAAVLKIGSLDVNVRVGGHRAQSTPMAPEIRRNAQGKAITSITSSRGYKGRWPITTVPMSSSAADTLESAVTTGLPLTVSGWLVGGSVTAKVIGDVTIEPDRGLNYVVSFLLAEQ